MQSLMSPCRLTSCLQLSLRIWVNLFNATVDCLLRKCHTWSHSYVHLHNLKHGSKIQATLSWLLLNSSSLVLESWSNWKGQSINEEYLNSWENVTKCWPLTYYKICFLYCIAFPPPSACWKRHSFALNFIEIKFLMNKVLTSKIDINI